MKIAINIMCAASLAAILCGCESFDLDVTGKRKQQIQQLETRTQESSRMQEEQLTKINSNFNILQSNHDNLSAKVKALQEKVQQLQAENGQLKQVMENERKAREASLDKMAEQMAKEIAKVAAARKAAAPAAGGGGKGPPAGGNYLEYKVQQGATLGAIAKAYGVTSAEIRAANNLENDNLKVGQTLYIPKK